MDTVMFEGFGPSIVSFTALMLNQGPSSKLPQDGGNDSSTFAVQCQIFPCMKTYSGTNISNFVLYETFDEVPVPVNPVTSTPSESSASYLLSGQPVYLLVSNRTLYDGTWSDCTTSNIPTSTDSVAIPKNGTSPEQPSNTYYPAECVWAVDNSTTILMQLAFEDLFNQANVPPPYITTGGEGAVWAQNLYNNGSADLNSTKRFMNGLTNSMTSIIRQRGDYPATNYFHGTAYTTSTCITVRWAWLSLPCSLLAVTIGFFVMVILKSKDSQKTWKSSPLALLFHGLDPRREKGTDQ